MLPSLKLASSLHPENGWLEDDPFLLGWPILQGLALFEVIYGIVWAGNQVRLGSTQFQNIGGLRCLKDLEFDLPVLGSTSRQRICLELSFDFGFVLAGFWLLERYF